MGLRQLMPVALNEPLRPVSLAHVLLSSLHASPRDKGCGHVGKGYHLVKPPLLFNLGLV